MTRDKLFLPRHFFFACSFFARKRSMTRPLDRADAWAVVRAYLSTYGLVRHQTDAYENFMLHLLPHIIRETHDIRVKHEVKDKDGTIVRVDEHVVSVCNVGVNMPTVVESDGVERDLMPHMARLRGLTYASNVVVDVVHDIYTDGVHVDRRIYREILLCTLPTMVGSRCCHTTHKPTVNECRLDQGGYFIVNGIEKALIAQERLRTNVPFVFALTKHTKYKLCCEIRACNEGKLRSTSTLCVYMTHGKRGAMPEMVAILPFMKDAVVPIFALFRLLRVGTREEVVALIAGDASDDEVRLLSAVIDNDATADMDTVALFEWLGHTTTEPTRERRQRYLDHIVSNEILPNMGLVNTPEVLHDKAAYLGYMVRKLIRVHLGQIQSDDRDHYAGKRVDPSGMGLLFRQLYRSMLKSTTSQMLRLRDQDKLRFTNVASLIGGKRITNAFRYAFATGTWTMQSSKASPSQTGVVQMIARMSVVAAISNMRKINTPISREGKQPKPRMLHYTSWGIVCPTESPEGTSCGLMKNLSMLAHVRVGTHSVGVVEHLFWTCSDMVVALRDVSSHVRASGYPVLVNGCLVGYCASFEVSEQVMTSMRRSRRERSVPFDTTVALVDGSIVVDTDPGCLMRPLLVAANMHRAREVLESGADVHRAWDRLLDDHVIEYVDKQEENMLRVGMWCDAPDADAAYTHYEIHPSLMLGLCAAMIPFPDHNQAPRNTYQSAMCKQSMGVYALNHARRMDTVAHVLCDPERPIVTTRVDSMIGISDTPSGVNCIVAIMVCKGYNQEDSLILNKSSVERGLFRSVKYATHRDEEKANGADSERFEKPDACQGMRVCNYTKLDASGTLPVGTVVKSGDVIIGKTVSTASAEATLKGHRKSVKHDKSVIVKHDTSVVDAVFVGTKPDGSRILKVKTRCTRSPMVGDKASSRMGQKGVVGRLLAHEDMPYTADGLVPDLIFNPHAIPSRMTLGQMLECLLGKLAAVRCDIADATPFCGTSVDAIADELESEGYDRLGNEVMYDGCTGRPYESKVFIGPTYYQRLKHMSADKAHARARGPKQVLTHQPLEGRARDGGLRFGEMERDCLVAHGVSDFLLERLMLVSDAFDVYVCGKCGNFATPPARDTHVLNLRANCRLCESTRHVVKLCVPYACKLLIQELAGMHVGVRLLRS